MPRYFFHITDGQTYPDTQGTELPSLEAARREAFRAFGDMLKNRDAWKSNEWVMDIADGADQSQLGHTFSVNETPR